MKSPVRFTVIPAIDIKGGKCVRLWQGDMDKETVYADDPVQVALRWEKAGAALIHIVDLDGAVAGKAVNGRTVKEIVDAVGVPLEIGGGIRDRRTMEAYFSLGVQRIILGTAACREPGRLKELLDGFPGEVYVGLDARDGMVAVEGWKEILPLKAADMARAAEDNGASGIIYTDISRDGTLEGPNLEAIAKLLPDTDLPVIASGGVSRLKDVEALAALAVMGVTGVIIGRALYAGKVVLEDALAYDIPSRGRG